MSAVSVVIDIKGLSQKEITELRKKSCQMLLDIKNTFPKVEINYQQKRPRNKQK